MTRRSLLDDAPYPGRDDAQPDDLPASMTFL
jgi:hypothetical protein